MGADATWCGVGRIPQPRTTWGPPIRAVVASAPITKPSPAAIQNTPCGRNLLADTTAADRTLAHLIRKDRTLAQRES